jgi:hypothetical protein
MIPRRGFFVVALLVALLAAPSSRAAPPQRVAFAVVIGNNRSLGNRRPDLHYADDDAAKYFAILRTVAPDHVSLLADLDDDTARLFPDARAAAAPPTRAELVRVGADVAERVRAAARDGDETDVYFVFAGHGDVDDGSGFIELEDARFTSADLEQWLRAIPFSRAHVILDSCNSFFMLGARRPGGRYYATSEDAARSLAARLPNVGVFLSTSAEGESFEWSEIQSGVFSHVVRSGLLGAADANGDGAVSYLELAAFVANATADVPNPNMRPHVFSRGPGGRDDEAILTAAGRTGTRSVHLTDSTPIRVRLRDRESLPLLDANEAAGLTLSLTLPDAWADGATIERASPTGGAAVLQSFAVPTSTAAVTLASLQPIDARGATRGPAEIFQRLFTRPFGPRTVASFLAQEQATPPPVYGVSREDAERMDLLLGQIAAADHGARMVSGTFEVGAAAYFGAIGASAFAFDRSDPDTSKTAADTWGAVSVGLGALSLGVGIYTLAHRSPGERLAAEYREAEARGDYAQAFALANERLDALAAVESRERWGRRVAGGLLVLAGTAGIVVGEATGASAAGRFDARVLGGAGIVLGATALASTFFVESPIERLTTVWRRDPSLVHIQPTVAPTQGGATVGFIGTF